MALLINPSQVILTPNTHGLEPVRKNHFFVEIQAGNGAKAPEECAYLVKSFDPPAKAVEVKTVRFLNHNKTYPGERSAVEAAPLVLRCMSKGPAKSEAHQFFRDWFYAIYSGNADSVGLITERNLGQIVLKPVRVQTSPFATVTLVGAWPSSIKIGGVDADSDGDCLDFTVIFQCQDVLYQFL